MRMTTKPMVMARTRSSNDEDDDDNPRGCYDDEDGDNNIDGEFLVMSLALLIWWIR